MSKFPVMQDAEVQRAEGTGGCELTFPQHKETPEADSSSARQLNRAAHLAATSCTPSEVAAERRELVRRWHEVRKQGLTADEAAKAVGSSRSTLYRWEQRAEPKSKRPHNVRQREWEPSLECAVRERRMAHPAWGKKKIAAALKREGVPTSESTVGRIIRDRVSATRCRCRSDTTVRASSS